MKAAPDREGQAVLWLTGQAALFGAMAALLGVVANAMFLTAYGAGWLPATYVAIGIAGVAISGTLAWAAQRIDLLRMAVAVLGGAAVVFVATWPVALQPGGAWVSAPLLVLFPVLLQLGFVFVGGQAGRILDVAGIKASFPRIMAGFPAGAVAGGLLAVPLVSITGRTEDLLLATAVAEAAFAGLVWATGQRYARELVLPTPAAEASPRGGDQDEEHGRSLRGLLSRPFVALILAYQVLSAVGSQVADYLVFDRATAAFSDAEDLARFIGGYTGVMNAVSIAFLFLVAGPLLRRFGLRFGIAANPLVLTIFAAGAVAALAGVGAASVVLLGVVSAARIADIALTDGTTRTSINALYQVLPPRPRIAVQTAVEGVGVPVAIGISGILILALNALPSPLIAMLATLLAVCAAWTWIGLRLYRSYGPALSDALRRRAPLDRHRAFEATLEDVVAARALIASCDTRSARLGVELVGILPDRAILGELEAVARDPRPDVRMSALAALASTGDGAARDRLAAEAQAAARASDVITRAHAAHAAGAIDASHRASMAKLLDDDSVDVRNAALESVQPGDHFAVAFVVKALEDRRTAPAAMRAFDRLGDATVPALESALNAPGGSNSAGARRMVRSITTFTSARAEVLRQQLGLQDRAFDLLLLERLAAPGAAEGPGADAVDERLSDAAEHAARLERAMEALADAAADGKHRPVLRALRDDFDVARRTVAAAVVARHGREALGDAVARAVARGQDAALALEAIEVKAGRAAVQLLRALFDRPPAPVRRSHAAAADSPADAHLDAVDWLRDMAVDREGVWRSAWLRACAIRELRLRGRADELGPESVPRPSDAVVREELELAAAAGRVGSGGAPP